MFRIKICGITRAGDAHAAHEAGADAVGLNFYPLSPRYVSRHVAREITRRIGTELVKVGVFVNASIEEIADTYDAVGLDVIQLHGDEPPALIASLAPRPVIRALRCAPGQSLATVVPQYFGREVVPQNLMALLIDAAATGQYGGTGRTLDWARLGTLPESWRDTPWILAGGLTPENVAEAIDVARPAAVDTAGGVESSPGCKSVERMSRFASAAHKAFQRLRDLTT